MTDNYGLVTIIDKWFDNYSKNNTTFLLEKNVTLFTFLKNVYNYIQEIDWDDIPEIDTSKTNLENAANSLYYTYLYCIEELIEKIRIIETKKVYFHSLPGLTANSSDSQKFGKFVDLLKDMKKRYISRDYYSNLQKENQKIGYDDLYNQIIYFGYILVPSVTYENGRPVVSFPYYKKYGEQSDNIYTKKITIISNGIEKDEAIESNFFYDLENYNDIIFDIVIKGKGKCSIAYGYNNESEYEILNSKSEITKELHLSLTDENKNYFPENTIVNVDSNSTLRLYGMYFYFEKGNYEVNVKYRKITSYNNGYVKVDKNGYEFHITTEKNGEVLTGTLFYDDEQIENIGTSGFSDTRYFYRKRNGTNDNYYETQFLFENGAPVDYLNNYENNIIIFADMFDAIKKTLEDKGENNYIDDFLKKYFYDGLLERYRTNEIEDSGTHLKITDTNFNKNKFKTFNTYETLKGKGRDINGFNSLDFAYKLDNGRYRFIDYKLDKSYFDNGKLYLYINVNKLDNYLKYISTFSMIDYDSEDKTFLNNVVSKYAKKTSNVTQHVQYYSDLEDGQVGKIVSDENIYKENAEYIKKYSNEIKEEILKKYFFIIRGTFKPESTIDGNFYHNYINELSKEYFYDGYKNLAIDVYFEDDPKLRRTKYLILKIDTSIKDSGKYDLGSGILYTGRLQQQLKDNIVSRTQSNQNVKRDINFEPEEFYSAMDDREFSVSVTSDIITNSLGQNLYWDASQEQFVPLKNFPSYRYSDLYLDEDGNYLLDVTNFSEYNNPENITQIRIVSYSNNSRKYLFNAKGVKTKYTKKVYFNLEANAAINAFEAQNYNISYYNDNILYFQNATIGSNAIVASSNKNETYTFEDDTITITPVENIFTNDKNYIYGGELHLKKDSDITFTLSSNKKPYYTMNVDGDEIDVSLDETYSAEKFLILAPNINSPSLPNEESEKVKIIDFIQTGNNSKFLELQKLTYDEKNNSKEYIYHEPLILKVKNNKINKKINIKNNTITFLKRNYFNIAEILRNIKVITDRPIINFIETLKFIIKPEKFNKLKIDFDLSKIIFSQNSYFTFPITNFNKTIISRVANTDFTNFAIEVGNKKNGLVIHRNEIFAPGFSTNIIIRDIPAEGYINFDWYDGKNSIIFGSKIGKTFYNCMYEDKNDYEIDYEFNSDEIESPLMKMEAHVTPEFISSAKAAINEVEMTFNPVTHLEPIEDDDSGEDTNVI